MNLIDALKSGRPFRRRERSWWVSKHTRTEAISCLKCNGEWFTEERYFADVEVGKADILADDWEIQEPTVTITRTQFWEAMNTDLAFPPGTSMLFLERAKIAASKLGLGDP